MICGERHKVIGKIEPSLATWIEMHKLQRQAFIKQYWPWLLLSVTAPLVVVLLAHRSTISEFKEKPADPPPLVAQIALFPGFVKPAMNCYQFHRWPNTIEHCDFRAKTESDAEVQKFYDEVLNLRGWRRRDAQSEGWKTPTKRSRVLAFYTRGNDHFFLEKPIEDSGEAEKNDVYRLLFTTILTTRRD